MLIQENISLVELTTMRIGGKARYVLTCSDNNDVKNAVQFARDKNLPWFVIGGGSNIVAASDYDGVIILNQIKGFYKIDDTTYKIGAGENWDETVARLCDLDLSGVECLSLVPGVAGSFPVQNVGAYGQDISQVLTELTAFDANTDKFVTLTNADCNFSYRDSIFKSQKDRHYIICDITLRLSKKFIQPPLYKSLQDYLDEQKITDLSPKSIRQAVIDIRNLKLPPVDKIPSAGSFFKNPLVTSEFATNFLESFPDAPHWTMKDGRVKLSAGWLIDQAGLKSYQNHGFQIYPKNALVVTNIANGTAEGLRDFRAEIIQKVEQKFGVKLEQEPESL
jgi:UDP-N-acetylmuramate dehydrogenase